MIILHGKEKKNMTAQELDALIAQFSRVVIDVGTGDGKNVYKSAKGAPDTLYIGLDAAAENMTDTAKKLIKKPEKGGLANCLLVVGTAENPPIELQGKADELTVYFPWGTLLQGVACAQEEMLSKLHALCKVGAAFTFVTTYSPSFEAAEIEKRGLPPLSIEFLQGDYADSIRPMGFQVEEVALHDNSYAAGFESAWAKRLAHGRKRDFYRVTGTIQ